MGREHWVETTIGQLCFTTSGGTPSRSNKTFYNGSIPWVKSGELKDGLICKTEEHISKDAIENSSAKLFPKDTILIALYGATIGKLGILGIDAATNQAVCAIFKTKALDDKFLFCYLLSERENLIKAGFGAAQPNISQQTIRDYSFRLPPLNEQKRIVSKLDAILPKVKSAKARLERIPVILKNFRQSVLAAACSGRLTEDWRESNSRGFLDDSIIDKIKKVKEQKFKLLCEQAIKEDRRKPKDHSNNKQSKNIVGHLPDLPDSWSYFRLEDICHLITDGTHRTPKYVNKGRPFLSVKNVRPFLIKDSDIKFITELEFLEINNRCNPEKGDILYTKIGATFGYAAINNLDYEFSIFVSLALIKPVLPYFDSKYAEVVMNSEVVFSQARERVTGIGTPDLHLIEIRDFRVPLPPLPEQHEIVHRLEKLFTLADSLEAKYKKAMSRVEKIEQSVLAKAFRGELVEPDPNDEPADELLKRVLEEKTRTEKKNSPRKRRIVHAS